MTGARHDWFITASGKRCYVSEPDPAAIDIEDIAAALARICRFGGHLKAGVEVYSVAQHSVLVSRLVPEDNALAGLMHDAPEAYLGDVIRPLKRELRPHYQTLEALWHRAIFERFGLDPELPPSVKHADMVALATERRDLIEPGALADYGGLWVEDEARVVPAGFPIVPLLPSAARALFLGRFDELGGRR